MGKYILTRKALNDLSDIWGYTFKKWSENQADKYYRMIIKNCANIAENPDLGKLYENIYDDLKGFIVGRHIIFYKKYDSESILIIRILHQQMDLKNRINE